MTDQSPTSLERDAERVRAELANTAEHLKEKMSPGQLMDEVVGYFKDGDTNTLLANLKHQVRDNPLALALVGGGLAWLMMGSGPATHHSVSRPKAQGDGAPPHPSGDSDTIYGGRSTESLNVSGSGGVVSTISEGAAEIGKAAGGAADNVGKAVGSATDSISATLHDARDAAGASLESAADVSADLSSRAKNTFLDALEREPLVIGALGVAVGAAIGAMLPPTRPEQEYLGPFGAQARRTVETGLAEGVDKAKVVAKNIYSAARDEADRQGLPTSEKTIAEKAAAIANVAGEELKAAADHSPRQAGETVDKTPDTLSSSTPQKT